MQVSIKSFWHTMQIYSTFTLDQCQFPTSITLNNHNVGNLCEFKIWTMEIMLDSFPRTLDCCNSVVGNGMRAFETCKLLTAVLFSFIQMYFYFLLGNFLFCCVVERTLERASSGILMYLILLPRM